MPFEAPGCQEADSQSELCRLLAHFLTYAHDPRLRSDEYLVRLGERYSYVMSQVEFDQTPARLRVPLELSTLAGLHDLLEAAMAAYGFKRP